MEDTTEFLKTRWGAESTPLAEYPRPQMVRESYLILNGLWDYAFVKDGQEYGAADGKILVPFAPESLLSGVLRTLTPSETLVYERQFTLPSDFIVSRVLLHFGAVDMDAEVFLNGASVGTHRGGYNAFSFDVTEFLKEKNVLRVLVRDETDTGARTRSKQTFRRGGIWYSPSSGIWQTVWMESVAERYLARLSVKTDYDGKTVTFCAVDSGATRDTALDFDVETVKPVPDGKNGGMGDGAIIASSAAEESDDAGSAEKTNGLAEESIVEVFEKERLDTANADGVGTGSAMLLRVKVYDGGRPIAEAEGAPSGVSVALAEFTAWSPECPKLYDATVTLGNDTVKTYFGMRKFEVKKDGEGIPRFYLNNAPYFMHGLLDQGYFSDGMYTAPTDAAWIADIEVAKSLGFNTLRKHIKVEPLRWYYHCDRLGMLVWQDMPSGGRRGKRRVTQIYPFVGIRLDDSDYALFGRQDASSREEFYREYREMLKNLDSVVSLAVWVPFNEGWGQFDANRAAELTKRVDKARLVDHASGWHDRGGGDFRSLHVYFKKVPHIKAEAARATVLSEFGGFSCKIAGHSFNVDKTFGYKIFKEEGALNRAFTDLYRNEVVPRIAEGLCADIYTQLSDVEDEVNGIMTYDRAVVKIRQKSGKTVANAIARAMELIK